MTIQSLLFLLIAFLVIFLWPSSRPAKSVTLYYAVDGYGRAYLYTLYPHRDSYNLVWTAEHDTYSQVNDRLRSILPPLTWEDEPVEVTLTF
jgi:hypothetical protein